MERATIERAIFGSDYMRGKDLDKHYPALTLPEPNIDIAGLLSRPSLTLLDITQIYYHPHRTVFGNRPFEFFLPKLSRNGEVRHKFLYSSITERTDYVASDFETREEAVLKLNKYVPSIIPALLIDTMRFVFTGKREIPLSTMVRYKAMNLEPALDWKSPFDPRYVDQFIVPEVSPLPVDEGNDRTWINSEMFFDLWTQQPDGLNDMRLAHRLLFGH